jgi:hypothetical protein
MPQLFVNVTPEATKTSQRAYNFETREQRQAFIDQHPAEIWWYYFPDDDAFGDSGGSVSWSNPNRGPWKRGPAWKAAEPVPDEPEPVNEHEEEDRW